MFDNLLIRPDSLRNDVLGSTPIGFQLGVRIANYRGVYLSLHTGYHLDVDGVLYPRAAQSFEINGKAPRSFDEIRSCVTEHWDFDDEAVLHVRAPGGLSAGEHVVRFQQCVLASYGYLPTDEAWVKEPPEPGTGAGSDKTPYIVTYTLTLAGDEPWSWS